MTEREQFDGTECEECIEREATEFFEDGSQLCGPCTIKFAHDRLTPKGRAALRAPASEGETVLWQYRYRFNALYSPWMRFAGAGEDGWMTMRSREARDEVVTRISDGQTFIVETRDLFTHPAPATVTEARP